jgi:hypothetical protein
MTEFQTWFDTFLVDAGNFFTEAWAQWDALSPDRRLAIVFGAMCLCSFLLACVYRRRLHRAQQSVSILEVGNKTAQQCITDLSRMPRPLCNYGDGIVEDEDDEDDDCYSISEDAVQGILDKMAEQHSAANRVLLDTVEQLTTAATEMHEKTMNTMNRMIDCVESGYNESGYDDDDEEDED